MLVFAAALMFMLPSVTVMTVFLFASRCRRCLAVVTAADSHASHGASGRTYNRTTLAAHLMADRRTGCAAYRSAEQRAAIRGIGIHTGSTKQGD